MSFQTFTRTFWKLDKNSPDGRSPSIGHAYPLEIVYTEEEAIKVCLEWNATHEPGILSKKAEYTSISNYRNMRK